MTIKKHGLADASIALCDLALKEIKTLTSSVDTLTRQRDEAREQRDQTKLQRDEARQQREKLRKRVLAKIGPQATRSLLSEGGDAPPPEDKGRAAASAAPAPAAPARPPARDPATLGDPLSTGDAFELERSRRRLEPAIRAKLAAGQDLAPPERETVLERTLPVFERASRRGPPPSADIAFVTVADHSFLPGLAALLLSLRDVYPGLESDVIVFHDGSLSEADRAQVAAIHPRASFVEPDMDWLDLSEHETSSRLRIGKLGYMKFCALGLARYRRVVVLDADVLVNGDISALWTGDETDLRIALDFGDREYAAVSAYTGREVLNSGVISIPATLLGAESFDAAQAVIEQSLPPLDDVIDRFADQKAWNVFLMGRPVTILPANYNCNIKYVGKFLGGQTEGVSVVHFAGPKPWSKPSKAKDPRNRSQQYPAFWINRARPLHFGHRLEQFRDEASGGRRSPVLAPQANGAATCLLVERLSELDHLLPAGEATREIVWIVDGAAEAADSVLAPHHAVLGWRNFALDESGRPAGLQPRSAELVRAIGRRPVLWAPFGAKACLERDEAFADHEINYLLHERPFVRYVDVVGAGDFDIDGYLDSARLDCLTYGAPIARALGFRRAVVVNHGAPTDVSTLFNAFRGGVDLCPTPRPQATTDRVHYAVRLTASALKARGLELLDGTKDRALPLPKWDGAAGD